jgi:hypothetical protein
MSYESIPHFDHLGGCASIIDAMPVALIFDSGHGNRTAAARIVTASPRRTHIMLRSSSHAVEYAGHPAMA